jgi:hypothetical protein
MRRIGIVALARRLLIALRPNPVRLARLGACSIGCSAPTPTRIEGGDERTALALLSERANQRHRLQK